MAFLPPDALASGESLSAAGALRFTAPELRAIMLGEQQDAARERQVRSALSRRIAWLFGLHVPSPLADPRLEALRRFSSKAHHHQDQLRDEDAQALIAAGYTAAEARGLTAYLTGRRRAGPAS